ncbi:hypothetical protein KGQ34_04535 [Patescibacteria group bacterium]|nr:hypothetical protein [Patescibacteria group bacterium]
MKSSKEFFESDPTKREREAVSHLPHTEESREEEERLNPARHAAKSKGYRGPYKNIEDVADARLNPEEELMAKEAELSDEDYKKIDDEAEEELSSEHLREEDYPEFHGSQEKWEKYLRSLPDQNYAALLRMKDYRRKHGVEISKISGEPASVKDIPEALLNKPIAGAYRHEVGRELVSKTDKRVLGRAVQALARRRVNVQKPKKHRKGGVGLKQIKTVFDE